MAHKTIILKGDPLRKEGKVNTGKTIYPGMLIELVTNDDTVQPHSTESGNAACMVAIENALEGQETGDSYAAGDRCQYAHMYPGCEFMAFLADSETVALGNLIESNGDGYWKRAETDSSTGTLSEHSMIAMALEAVTGSSASGQLIKALCI